MDIQTRSVSLVSAEKTGETTSVKIEESVSRLKTGESAREEYQRPQGQASQSYSTKYIKFNLDKTLGKLIEVLRSWSESFQESKTIVEIFRLQKILEENDRFYYADNNARILITLLKLIFTNNNWLTIKQGQLNQLIEALEGFQEGTLDSKKIEVFINQIFRAKLGILDT